jgi:hypothetical protein
MALDGMSALGQKRTKRSPRLNHRRDKMFGWHIPDASEIRLHLNSDAVDRLSGSVENPPEWLRCHIHDQASLAIPILDRLHDISVRRKLSPIWSNIVYRPLHLVEHEHRWPSMMMDRLFVVWLQGYLKHAKSLVLEDNFVMLRSRHHGIQCWIPSRWIQIGTVIGHVTPPVQLNA